MEAEWRNAPDFAEVAEALGIETFKVFGAHVEPRYVVIYTPDIAEEVTPAEMMETTAYIAILKRDESGILRIVGEPRVFENFGARFKQATEDLLRRMEEGGDEG